MKQTTETNIEQRPIKPLGSVIRKNLFKVSSMRPEKSISRPKFIAPKPVVNFEKKED